MGYNKKALSKIKADLNSAKGPAQPRDIIYDPRGQWRHPGKPTRIPGGNITMQDVPYPVMAYPNVGQPQIMYPNQDYQFPGADYVDEYPQMKKGGSKKYSRDITATNRLLMKNPLFKKRKSKKKKIFDPNSPYFQSGGYLPKAQKGLLNLADSKVEVVPFSYNYSNPQGQTIWGKPYSQEPTYRVGIEAPIRKPKEGYHTLNLDVGLPYSGKLKPSTELRYDWYNKPTLGSENIQLPYVQMTGRAGYDPVEKGFAGMSARTYYGFGTAKPQTKSKPAQFRKNTWWSTLGPAFDFNLGDMQMVENPEFRGGEKRFMIDPEWAYGVKGDVEYRPGKDKNLRLGARYAVMFDPVEGKNMEMLGYKPNSEDRLQFAVNPSLEVYGNYGVDLEPDFKKRTSGKLTDISKTTGTTTQNKNTGNTVVIDGIPVEVENTKETLEPCPAGYRRDRPDGECLPIERHHHPRWLKEGGKLGPIPLNSGRKVLRDWTYGKTIGMLQEQDGGVPYNTSGPVVEQERLEEYPEGEAPKIYGHEPEDYKQFLAYSETAPENRRAYSDYVYGDPDTYDQYGFWESIGKPKDWDAALKAKDESGEQLLYPDPYDNMYHGFSVNPNTGVFLKSGKPGFKEGDTTWMEIAGHYLSPRAQEDTPVFDPELGRFKYIPAENDGGYIETELTPEEIRVYREGGYIVEELD